MSGGRVALRIARRDALRARWRSVVVVLMVALPVAVVVGVDTLARTADVGPVERLPRTLGAADAVVRDQRTSGPVVQDPYGDSAASYGEDDPPATGDRSVEAAIRAALPGARLVPLPEGPVVLRTASGRLEVQAEEVPLTDPLTAGLVELVGGRAPATAGEIAVTERAARLGLAPGASARVEDGRELTVVGTVRYPDELQGLRAVAAPGTLPLPDAARWLVDTAEPVTWAQVRALNAAGLLAVSRAVVLDPPPPADVPVGVQTSGPLPALIAVAGLAVAMALLEVVLLAGPAFAVGARRQRRALALLAATGAEPRHLRRVVLAGGLVLGGVAALLGATLGIGGAYALRPVVQRLSDAALLGPFQVAPVDVALIAGAGVASAVLAALLPAVTAARADVVAVLAGRRGDLRTPRAVPLGGLALLAIGVAGSVVGARRSGGEFLIAFASIGTVLGAVLLCPSLLGLAGRAAGRLPLTARFAVRDAARTRGRTAPAVAAVAATVAGVVALGTGASSDTAEQRAEYVPRAPEGIAVLQSGSGGTTDWPALQDVVQRELPGATVTPVLGVPVTRVLGALGPGARAPGTGARDVVYQPCPTGVALDEDRDCALLSQYTQALGSPTLIGPRALDTLSSDRPAAEVAAARRALDAGGVAVFADAPLPEPRVTIHRLSLEGTDGARQTGEWTLPAARLSYPAQAAAPAAMVLSERAAATLGIRPQTVALAISDVPVPRAEQDRLMQALAGVDAGASLYVERGFDERTPALVLLLLGAGGAVLVLGGTVTATLLALSDARPDLATLAAVGAAPGARRRIAACYAATVGVLGALLGCVAGLVPGIAVAFPLTGDDWAGDRFAPGGSSAFVDVPWTLLGGLVLGVPLLAALAVGLAVRARLPMTARQPA